MRIKHKVIYVINMLVIKQFGFEAYMHEDKDVCILCLFSLIVFFISFASEYKLISHRCEIHILILQTYKIWPSIYFLVLISIIVYSMNIIHVCSNLQIIIDYNLLRYLIVCSICYWLLLFHLLLWFLIPNFCLKTWLKP